MSCQHRNIKLSNTTQVKKLSCRYAALSDTVIIPVFCVCMITAMGSSAGLRHAVFMQFDVDRDTEYIVAMNAGYFLLQTLAVKKFLNN